MAGKFCSFLFKFIFCLALHLPCAVYSQSGGRGDITAKFVETPLGYVFHMLSIVSGIDFSVSPEVSDIKISLTAKERSINEILKVIEKSAKVYIQKIENFFVVLPEGRKHEELEVILYSPSFVEPKKLAEFLSGYISGAGTVKVWEGKLIVVDTPEKIGFLQKLLEQVDRKPKQYVIKAHIAEFSLSEGVGVDSILNYISGGFRMELGDRTGGWALISLSFDRITKMLELLAQKDKVDIISSPSVITVEGVPARIVQGVSVPYFSQSLATGLEVGYVDAVLMLEVTPLRDREGRVRLKVVLTRNFPAGQVEGFPIISKSELTSDIVVELGRTVAVGGIVVSEQKFSRVSVPILGDVPILGYLFSSTRKTTLKSQIVVFISPFVHE